MSSQRTQTDDPRYLPISAYGLIGDCHTCALVGTNGSIDWYCPPRFDAPAVFCRILDADRGGSFQVCPVGAYSTRRRYLEDTNVLETTFTSESSVLTLTDFMPVHQRREGHRGHDVGTSRRILRRVHADTRDTQVRVRFHPTFDYARADTRIDMLPGSIALAHTEGQYLSLACPGHGLEFHKNTGAGLVADIDLREGQSRWLVLTDCDDPDRAVELPDSPQCDAQLARTTDYWKKWAAICTYHGPYRDLVLRSALTLKLLTYEPTGAIVAAPTTSLPEEMGGVRNWDYRYAWLRDSALILYALLTIGYEDEAADFFEWLQETHKQDPTEEPQVLYGIDGRHEIPESILDNLEGYRASSPVRIGNGAALQTQLDIYGEVLTAAYLYFKMEMAKKGGGGEPGARSLTEDWPLLRGLVARAAALWQEPDNGIWETRGGRQRFLYSALMCWAALDRGIRLAGEHALQAPVDSWTVTRAAIEHAILTDGYDSHLQTFAGILAGGTLDASSLILPRVGFLPPVDPRVQSTVGHIKRQLVRGGLVLRYKSEDGLPGTEGAFLTCTFWLVDVLALSGQVDEAEELFRHAARYVNEVGLLSEEVDVSTGALLGNFPQGFSHMALINSAVNLSKAKRHGPEQYAETEVDRAQKARQPRRPAGTPSTTESE